MPYELLKKTQPWAPHEFQKRAARFLLQNAAAALFLSPGLGKTSITLAALKTLFDKKMIKKVLIIAPLRVAHLVWPAEQAKWENFKNLRVVVLHGPKKDERLLDTEADIYVINPEGLQWLVGTRAQDIGGRSTRLNFNRKRWMDLGFDTLVIDELSKFKNQGSLRFKTLKLVHKTFTRKWGLTGSPAANGLIDLFGQCFILDEGRTFGPYITHFRDTYFTQGYNGFTWDLKPGAAERIYERIKPLALQMSAEDYLTMPELIENSILVDLPPAARKIYKSMEDELIAAIDNKIVTAANAAVASGKCRQIASGGIYHNTDLLEVSQGVLCERLTKHIHDAKTDALEDLIEELQGAPLLVAYDFNHDLERLLKRFGKDTPVIGGGVSMNETAVIERAWNRGEIKLLFAHPLAAGHGINLQGSAQHVCWYSLTWNLELYEQFIRRVYRQGNAHATVFVHHILARNSIDDKVLLPVLRSKDRTQKSLFAALKDLKEKT